MRTIRVDDLSDILLELPDGEEVVAIEGVPLVDLLVRMHESISANVRTLREASFDGFRVFMTRQVHSILLAASPEDLDLFEFLPTDPLGADSPEWVGGYVGTWCGVPAYMVNPGLVDKVEIPVVEVARSHARTWYGTWGAEA